MIAIHFAEPNTEVTVAGGVVGVIGLRPDAVKGAHRCYSLVNPESFVDIIKEGSPITQIVANKKFNLAQVYVLAAIAKNPEIYADADRSQLWRAIMAEVEFRRNWTPAPFCVSDIPNEEEAKRSIMYPRRICFTHESPIGGPVLKAIEAVTDTEMLLDAIARVITENSFEQDQKFWKRYVDEFLEERSLLAQAFVESLKAHGGLVLSDMRIEQFAEIGGSIAINAVSRSGSTYIWFPMSHLEAIYMHDWVAVVVAEERIRKTSPIGFRYSPHVIVFSCDKPDSAVYTSLQGQLQQPPPGWRPLGRGFTRGIGPGIPVSQVVCEIFPHLGFHSIRKAE